MRTSTGSHTQKASGQPAEAAMRGATSAATAVPILPMPYTPNANPWRSGGNQRTTNGTPTANEAPATPSKRLTPSSAPKEAVKPATSTGTQASNNNPGNT